MLNISENSISKSIQAKEFKVFELLTRPISRYLPIYLTSGALVIVAVFLFLPWTQNIQAKGYLISLSPDKRPQAIQSVISGKLDKWFVREGSFVKKGDTIVYITEVKSEYFDPNLVLRTSEQVDAKFQSVSSYNEKIKSLEQQFDALKQARKLKLEQTQNKIGQARLKIRSDSIDLVAIQNNLKIAEKQYNRTKELYDKGLKSLTDLETKNLKWQEIQAKFMVKENKILNEKNELLNLELQLSAIKSEYADKLAKSQSEKFSAVSNKLNAVAMTSKLKNQLSNYSQRQKFYYITAPQDGYVTKVVKKGLGEIIKEGTDIVTIVPVDYDLAVEIYVKPQDLPLLSIGNSVRLQFDGWPALVFNGWPNTSVGTFSGKVVAIDQYISNNGKYRLIISPNGRKKEWPEQLRLGSGAQAFILLNNVPLWYEVWRQMNGFPPDFYQNGAKKISGVKTKAPIKSVK